MAYRKLRDVRIELQARLGFGSTDQSRLAPILNSFLQEAQEQLYAIGFFKSLDTYWDVTVPSGSANVAYDVTVGKLMSPDKIREIKVDIGSGSPYWNPVTEGIRPCDYNNDQTGYPVRYEKRGDGLEFSPGRDQAYTVRVFGMRKLNQLRDDDDAFDIDDRLCFVVALGAAKAHYRHPDAKEYQGKAGSVFASVKWANSNKLIKAADKEESAEPRPVVV